MLEVRCASRSFRKTPERALAGGLMPEVAASERTLPHNLEAEKSVLGAILIHNEAFNHAAELIDSRDFFRDAHRRIFDKMIVLSERGDAIDLVTLKDELQRSSELEEVGGPAYIASLADGVPRSANVEHYARIVKEKSTLRNLIHSANRILSTAYEAEQDADLILDDAEKAIFEIAEDRIREGFVPLRDLVQSSFATIEKLQQHKGMVTGVPTGFVDLDEMTSGSAAVGSRPRRGAAVDGQDQLRPQHRAARRDSHRHDGRLLQPRDVQRAAVHAHADVGSADRRPSLPQRLSEREGLRAAVALARHAGRGARLHRRHGVDRRPRDARQGPAPPGRARPAPADHRLHSADAGPRPVREPAAGARVDLALAEGAGEGAARADRRAVAAVAGAGNTRPTTGRNSPTCASPARSSRTPTS